MKKQEVNHRDIFKGLLDGKALMSTKKRPQYYIYLDKNGRLTNCQGKNISVLNLGILDKIDEKPVTFTVNGREYLCSDLDKLNPIK